ncbi:MAG: glycosyltransferase family 39 protein [Candidatus Eremiobacteraeota bacterium]|nr:glycosyltransferase family 39 protein [Candidatus Eremiobacteraeota bacterium]
MNRNQIGWMLGALTFVLHGAVMSRYGYQTDELYFIDCAKHLAWGFVDQPPLAPFFVWLSAPFDYALWAVRFWPSLAAALAVVVSCRVALEMGGGRIAQAVTGLAVALSPVDLGFGYGLTTSSLEPLTWTLVALFTMRLIRTRDTRWYFAIAAVAVVGLYMKYTISLELAALAGAVLLTRDRRLLRSWNALYAALLVILATAPNWIWQVQHGLPIIDVMHTDQQRRFQMQNGLRLESPDPFLNGLYFIFAQFFYTGPGTWVLWVTGIVAFFRNAKLAPYRALGIAYILMFVALILLAGRGYYICGYYPVLIAAGAVTIVDAVRSASWRYAVAAATLALSLPMLPLSLPVLSVNSVIAYGWYLGIGRATPDKLPHLIAPQFALEFGWRDFAAEVSALWKELPAAQRAHTSIYADAYGFAGALNHFGPRYGLPRVISANNNYYLWGYGDWDGKSLLAVGATQHDLMQKYFKNVKLLATFWDEYRWVEEGPLPVYLCTGPRASRDEIWRGLRRFGV